MLNHSQFNIQVYSNLFNKYMTFPVYEQENRPGEYVLLHNGLKSYMLGLMSEQAKNKTPISIEYTPVETALSHSIAHCSIEWAGGYKVTETGESSVATLNSTVAKNYPYMQAEIRAFDRAVISFLQLNIDGRRVYSDEEF